MRSMHWNKEFQICELKCEKEIAHSDHRIWMSKVICRFYEKEIKNIFRNDILSIYSINCFLKVFSLHLTEIINTFRGNFEEIHNFLFKLKCIHRSQYQTLPFRWINKYYALNFHHTIYHRIYFVPHY